MKKIIIYIQASVLFLALACKPEVKEIGPYLAPGDGIVGSWQLDKVVLADLSLPVPEEDDPTDFYKNYPTQWQFTFLADSTYLVDEKGPGPDVFGTNGTWHFDQYPYPKAIHFYSATDTVHADLENMPRETDTYVGFTFTRNGCGADYMSYTFTLKRKEK